MYNWILLPVILFLSYLYDPHSIELDFDVLVLQSEVWNYNLDFYNNIFNYTFCYKAPHCTKVGGVGMYIKNTFNYNELVESLWLEVSNSNKKYVVAGIYRHPNSNISHFCKQLENSLELVTIAYQLEHMWQIYSLSLFTVCT